MKLFLDTNVLIDYYTSRQPYRQFCMKLLAMQIFEDVELWASAKSFTDVFYVGRKFVDPHALQQAFLDSAEFLNVCSLDAHDIEVAAEKQWLDFEDCTVAVCAQKVGADLLITRDVKGFEESPVDPISPEDFFTYLEKEYGLVYEDITL